MINNLTAAVTDMLMTRTGWLQSECTLQKPGYYASRARGILHVCVQLWD